MTNKKILSKKKLTKMLKVKRVVSPGYKKERDHIVFIKAMSENGMIRSLESEIDLVNEAITGTSLIDTIKIEFEKLNIIFGKPTFPKGDHYKSDAMWAIFTPLGVVTIYNYKDGQNYLGKDGLKNEEITNWHLGAHNHEAVDFIKNTLLVLLNRK